MSMSPHFITRFWRQVLPEPNTGCWLWTGSLSESGEALFWDGRRRIPATHYWAALHGEPLPSDGQPVHRCGMRCCVNPAHVDLHAVLPTTTRPALSAAE
jgi:hypothetical protein